MEPEKPHRKARLVSLRQLTAVCCLIAAGWIIAAAGLPDRITTGAVVPVKPGETPVAPEVGALAPPIEVVDLRGERLSLAALRGKAVIINFWATWCAPCVEEMPAFQAVYAAHSGSIAVVGVNFGEPPADALNWAVRLNLTFALVADRDGRIARLYQVRGLPSTYFIGRDGVIRYVAFGPLTRQRIEDILKSIWNP